jgi:hypothetical protein
MDVRRQIIPAYNDLGESVIHRSNDSRERAALRFTTVSLLFCSSRHLELLLPFFTLHLLFNAARSMPASVDSTTPAPEPFSRLLFSSSLSVQGRLLCHLPPRVFLVVLSARPLVLPPSLNRSWVLPLHVLFLCRTCPERETRTHQGRLIEAVHIVHPLSIPGGRRNI